MAFVSIKKRAPNTVHNSAVNTEERLEIQQFHLKKRKGYRNHNRL